MPSRWRAGPVGVVLACALAACMDPDAVAGVQAVGQLDYGGRVERIESLGRYTKLEATLLLQLAGASGKVSTGNDYYLYRVIYHTAGLDGAPTRVSGLVAVPATRNIKGIVSWHHGTNTYRPESISKPSLPEGLGMAAVFAGDGFILAAADYIGLGVSTEMHPYYHWPTIIGSVVDLLLIAEVMLEGIADLPERDLYLAGFSEGGAATAAVHEFLESNNPTGLNVRGAAAISGAFNLRDISLQHAMKNDDTFHFGYLLAAFSHVYGEPLDEIVRAPYKDRLAEWFDGTKDADFLKRRLPSHLSELLTEQFVRDFEAGVETPRWFYDALRAASSYDYAPRTPLRIHFGTTDTTVVPEEAHAAFAHMRALGGNVTLVEVGPYDHEQIVVQTMPAIQQWFNELDRSGP